MPQRRHPAWQNTNGYADTAAVSGGHLDPGMAVLTKPFAVDELAKRMRDLIEA